MNSYYCDTNYLYDTYNTYDDHDLVLNNCDYNNYYYHMEQIRFCNTYRLDNHISIINLIGQTIQFVTVMTLIQMTFDKPLRNFFFETIYQYTGLDFITNHIDEDTLEESNQELNEDIIEDFLNKIELSASNHLNLSEDTVDEIINSVNLKIKKFQHKNKMKILQDEITQEVEKRKEKQLRKRKQEQQEMNQIISENDKELQKAVNDSSSIENRKKSFFYFF
jgi:hypothetical protein